MSETEWRLALLARVSRAERHPRDIYYVPEQLVSRSIPIDMQRHPEGRDEIEPEIRKSRRLAGAFPTGR